MVRRSALIGSLVVHGALALGGVVLAVRGVPDRPEVRSQDVAIELVVPAARLAPLDPSRAAHADGLPPTLSPALPVAPRHARTSASHATHATHAPGLSTRAVETTVRIEPPSRMTSTTGVAEGAGIGDGDGGGNGRGAGIGAGVGGWIDTAVDAEPLPVPAPEPVPATSRARPPQLVYPARDREIEDSRLFVARLTIDSDGFVVGARLVRGVGGRRDDQAASAVWRFRYRPALDDEGRPTQATIDQRFGVE